MPQCGGEYFFAYRHISGEAFVHDTGTHEHPPLFIAVAPRVCRRSARVCDKTSASLDVGSDSSTNNGTWPVRKSVGLWAQAL
jgi:hypothetical protein